MELFEAFIDEENYINGIHAVSLVDDPAIESQFVKFSKEQVTMKAIDKDKQLICGAILIPNKPIYRNDDGYEYHMFFSKDTVRRAMELFFIKKFQSNATFQHAFPIESLTMVESWIVEDVEKDKSAHYGLSVPIGTWVGTMKVEDKEVWRKFVKDSTVTGFSIEGYFVPQKTNMRSALTPEQKVKIIMSLLNG